MIDKSGGKAGEYTTVIGPDAVFKGELAFEKGVRVDGRVEGKIATKGHLAVSKGGKLQADVAAGNIVVEGQVAGNLHATDRVELRNTARLQGDIKAAKLLVAEGAAFVGHCTVGSEMASHQGQPAPAPAAAAANRIQGREALPKK